MNTETTQQNTQLLYNECIEGTPFRVIGNEEAGYILVIGKYRLTAHMETPEDAENELKRIPWDIQFRMVASMLQLSEDRLEQLINQIKQQ